MPQSNTSTQQAPALSGASPLIAAAKTRRRLIEAQIAYPGHDVHRVIICRSTGFMHCDCKGFRYRGHCSHIGEVAMMHGLIKEVL